MDTTMSEIVFGQRLRELRKSAGLTQEELADKAGLQRLAVTRLERGEREPSWQTLLALAKALGVSLAVFDPSSDESADTPTP